MALRPLLKDIAPSHWIVVIILLSKQTDEKDEENNYPKLLPSGKTPRNLGEKRCATPLFTQISGLLIPGSNLS
jgi:hypothetical protein